MLNLLELSHTESPALRETIETLVRLESPSTDKRAADRCGAEIARRLELIGGEVQRLPQPAAADHVCARFGSGRRRVLLLGHFDTVWNVGQIARMPFHEREGRLYGPGIFDMKSGLAVAMHAIRVLQSLGGAWPRVTMLWTGDEEVGSVTSRAEIERAARDSDAVLVLEPSLPGGAAKTSRKGCGEFELTVRGVSAHAGVDPARGVSAILELAHQILRVASLQAPERGVTINVGVVTGGTRGNVVADEARAVVDVRVPTMAEAKRVEGALRALSPWLPGARLELRGEIGRPPLERTAAVHRLYLTAREVAAELGFDLGEGGTGGGSDGNFTAALGVPTLDGLGPRGDGAHAADEHVEAADLPWRTAFLAALLARLEEVQ
jgi:glutamate carboxypeptidase